MRCELSFDLKALPGFEPGNGGFADLRSKGQTLYIARALDFGRRGVTEIVTDCPKATEFKGSLPPLPRQGHV